MTRTAGAPVLPVTEILRTLEALATPRDLANLEGFGIAAPRALGVSMANIQKVARIVGRDHGTALALWASGIYEARLLAAYVDDPAEVTIAQMVGGAATSTTGACATPSASRCSIAPRGRGGASTGGRRPVRSSSGARRSR